jgi:hypothetical protein
MFKFNIILLLFILILSCTSITSGQEQNSFSEYITKKFTDYCRANPREEIFVHSDRSEYIAGEELWFNIYLIDRQSNNLTAESKIASIEILNQENRPVAQKRILLDNGSGQGQITLPDTLSSGSYIIRAYTNYMKNFLPLNCFMNKIFIYNAFSNRKFILSSDICTGPAKKSDQNKSGDTIGQMFDLHINNTESDSLEITITSDKNFQALNSNQCHLFIQTHGIINYIAAQQLNSPITRTNLPKKILPPGINHITIFDLQGQVVLERLIYTPERESNHLTINSRDTFKTRDSISIALLLDKELLSAPGNTNLSISVSPKTDADVNSDISDYMVFGSEFGDISNGIESFGLRGLAPDVVEKLLLSLKSNWIDWSIILSDKQPAIKYYREDEDHILSGRLIIPDSLVSRSDHIIFLSSPRKNAVFQYAKTDKDGLFNLHVPINDEMTDLIVQPENASGHSTISIESSYAQSYRPAIKPYDTSHIAIPGYISDWSINYQVRKIFGLSSEGAPPVKINQIPEPKRFYGKPDIELVTSNYVNLADMEEIFFELIPGVHLKSRNSSYKMTIANPIDNSPYQNPPVLLIDGVVINDPSAIGNLDPGFVEKIDAFRSIYMVGDFRFYGLVNVITKACDFSSVTLPDYAVRLKYRVIDPVNSFVSPDYSTAERRKSRIPDMRNTLYWNPSVRPDAEGKARIEFWASDIPGEYEVNIQGMAPSGYIECRKTIRVK